MDTIITIPHPEPTPTPTNETPTPPQNSYRRPLGIKDRILTATSRTEIQSLLDEGLQFRDASPGTIRGWQRAADKRCAMLHIATL